jgi:hypothetical protein
VVPGWTLKRPADLHELILHENIMHENYT